MRGEPILASRTLSRPRGKRNMSFTFTVFGGLHYIKGNKLPYFTLTYTEHRKGFPDQLWSGGAGHDTILKLFPRFADLAALHLSDLNGEPMHAVENGLYYLAGAAPDHFGKEYFQKDRPLEVFADHWRVTMEDAENILAHVSAAPNPKEALALLAEAARPRWKAEAYACIKKHGLKLFGANSDIFEERVKDMQALFDGIA